MADAAQKDQQAKLEEEAAQAELAKQQEQAMEAAAGSK